MPEKPSLATPHRVPALHKPRSIVVRFKDSVALPYVDQLEYHFLENKSAVWEALAKLAPKATFRRLFQNLPGDQLKEILLAPGVKDKDFVRPRLEQYHILDAVAGTSFSDVLATLQRWPDVQTAYSVDRVIDPAVVNPVDDGLSQYQLYLRPAPFGVNAYWAWQQAGGDGERQAFLDLEGGWTLDHVDLLTSAGVPRASLIYGTSISTSAWHGTAVLGIVCATDNATHIVGVAPNVPAVRVLSHSGDSSTIPEAILVGVKNLAPGGDLGRLAPGVVLLLEVALQDDQGRVLPVEVDPAIQETIWQVGQLGVTVIVAAGNGYLDLDSYIDFRRDPNGLQIFNRNSQQFIDSGAIFVGSAEYVPDLNDPNTPWTRRRSSNWGSRIDCFGMGEMIVTLTSSEAHPQNDWTDKFNGTSGAAAIIAGAALSLQGMAAASRGRPFTPRELRDCFSDIQPSTIPGVRPNTPTVASANGGRGGISVMPSLRYLALKYLGLTDPAAPPTNLRIID